MSTVRQQKRCNSNSSMSLNIYARESRGYESFFPAHLCAHLLMCCASTHSNDESRASPRDNQINIKRRRRRRSRRQPLIIMRSSCKSFRLVEDAIACFFFFSKLATLLPICDCEDIYSTLNAEGTTRPPTAALALARERPKEED